MKALAFIFMLLLSAPCLAAPPLGVEVFKRAGLGTPMEIKTSDLRFSIEEIDGAHLIKGKHSNGRRVAHAITDGGVKNVQRLHVVQSNFCEKKFTDLVLQMNPGRYEESQRRSYYRIVFSSDLSEVVSEFYDPSVAAVYAVLPMQSVEGLAEPDLGSKIICEGGTPKVSYPNDHLNNTP